jgi:CHAT domain-containing protein
VLAACSTAAESDGLDGLTRPFLAAGLSAVVASLWNIGDQLAVPLLVDFHHRLASGGDALHALQAAQVALLHSPRDLDRLPAGWAAFRLIGEAASPRAASAVGRD